MKNLLVIVFLVVAYYALRRGPLSKSVSGSGVTVKDNLSGNHREKNLTGETNPNEPFESSFENGLPADYIPSDISHYSDIQKLKEDYQYRWNKLHHHFEEEKKELLANKDYSKEKMDELVKKQKLATNEYNQKHKNLRDEFLKRIEEERSSRDKGLR